MPALELAYLALASAFASGLVALGADRNPALLRYAASLLLAISGLAAGAAGAWLLWQPAVASAQLPGGLP